MTERDESPDWIAQIRRRPGMYVGSVHDGQGLHHMLWELCANAIDLYLRRASSRLHVSIDDDVLTVDDDGHGYPVDDRGTPLVTAYLTTIHDTATRDDHSPHVHVGGTIQGVGIAVVNALSECLEITTRIEGREWHQRFERGRPVTELRDVGPTARRGTTIRYRPDIAIFGDITPARAHIRHTLHELAYLNGALDVRLDDTDLSEPDGLSALVRATAAPRALLDGSPIRATATRHDVHVDVAIGWTGETATHASAPSSGRYAVGTVGLMSPGCSKARPRSRAPSSPGVDLRPSAAAWWPQCTPGSTTPAGAHRRESA